MINIYENLKKHPNDDFQLCFKTSSENFLWLAPRHGNHSVKQIMEPYNVSTVHFFIIPEDCTLTDVCWTKDIESKGNPMHIRIFFGMSVIHLEPFSYGVSYRL